MSGERVDLTDVFNRNIARLAEGIKRGEEVMNDPWPTTTPQDRRIAGEIRNELIEAKRQNEEARAAVADLIDADRKVDEIEAAIQAIRMAGPRPHSYGTGWELRDAAHRRELEGELEAAHKRRAAALSRIQPDGHG